MQAGSNRQSQNIRDKRGQGRIGLNLDVIGTGAGRLGRNWIGPALGLPTHWSNVSDEQISNYEAMFGPGSWDRYVADVERLAQPPPMADERAPDRSVYREPGYTPNYRNASELVASEFTKFRDDMNRRVEAGLASPEDAEAMIAREGDYIRDVIQQDLERGNIDSERASGIWERIQSGAPFDPNRPHGEKVPGRMYYEPEDAPQGAAGFMSAGRPQSPNVEEFDPGAMTTQKRLDMLDNAQQSLHPQGATAEQRQAYEALTGQPFDEFDANLSAPANTPANNQQQTSDEFGREHDRAFMRTYAPSFEPETGRQAVPTTPRGLQRMRRTEPSNFADIPEETTGTYSPPPDMAGAFAGGEQLSPKVVQTIIAESLGEGPEGMRLVAETIMNRARERGITPEQVVLEKGQYAPHARALPAGSDIDVNDPENIAAATQAWGVAQGPEDPTMGAEYFYAGDTPPSATERLQVVYEHGNHRFLADTSTVKEMQTNLKAQGLYDGAIDGDFGPATRTAANAFREGLGTADPVQALTSLGVEPAAGQEAITNILQSPESLPAFQNAAAAPPTDPRLDALRQRIETEGPAALQEAMATTPLPDMGGQPLPDVLQAQAPAAVSNTGGLATEPARVAEWPALESEREARRAAAMSPATLAEFEGAYEHPANWQAITSALPGAYPDTAALPPEMADARLPRARPAQPQDAAVAAPAPPASGAGVDANGQPVPYSGDYNDILDNGAAPQPGQPDRSDLTSVTTTPTSVPGSYSEQLRAQTALNEAAALRGYGPSEVPDAPAPPPDMAGDYADFETTRANVRSPETLRDMMGQAGLDDSQWDAGALGIPSQSIPPSNLPPLMQQQYEQAARRDWARPQAPEEAPQQYDTRREAILSKPVTYAPYNAEAEAAAAHATVERLNALNNPQNQWNEMQRELGTIARTQPIGPPESRNYRIGQGLRPDLQETVGLGGPDAPPFMAEGSVPPSPQATADIGLTAMPNMTAGAADAIFAPSELTSQDIANIQQQRANPPPGGIRGWAYDQNGQIVAVGAPTAPAPAPTPAVTSTTGTYGETPAPAAPVATGGVTAPIPVRDLSAHNPYRRGPLDTVAGVVIHHTGPASSPEGVLETLKQRELSYNYLVDRNGDIISLVPEGQRGAHIKGPGNKHATQLQKELGLSNTNTVGISLIAADDTDVTPQQLQAVQEFTQQKWPGVPVYGHGELNDDKQEKEGMTAVTAIRSLIEQNKGTTQTATPATPLQTMIEAMEANNLHHLTLTGDTITAFQDEAGTKPWTPEQQATVAKAVEGVSGSPVSMQYGELRVAPAAVADMANQLAAMEATPAPATAATTAVEPATTPAVAPAAEAAPAPAAVAAPTSTMRDVAMAAHEAGFIGRIDVDPVTNRVSGYNHGMGGKYPNGQPWTAEQRATIAAAVPGIVVDADGGLSLPPAAPAAAVPAGVTGTSDPVEAKPGSVVQPPAAAVPLDQATPAATDEAPDMVGGRPNAVQIDMGSQTDPYTAAGQSGTGIAASVADAVSNVPPNMNEAPRNPYEVAQETATQLGQDITSGALRTGAGYDPALAGANAPAPVPPPVAITGTEVAEGPGATTAPTGPARVQLTAPAGQQYNTMEGPVVIDAGPLGPDNLGVLDAGPRTSPLPPVMSGKEKDDYLGPTTRVVQTVPITPGPAALIPNVPVGTYSFVKPPTGKEEDDYVGPAPVAAPAPAPATAPVLTPGQPIPQTPDVPPAVVAPPPQQQAPPVEKKTFQEKTEAASGRSKTWSDPVEYAARNSVTEDGKFDHDKFWDQLGDVDLTQTQQTVAAKTAAQGHFTQNKMPNFLSGLNMPDMGGALNAVQGAAGAIPNPVNALGNFFGGIFGGGGFDPRSQGVGSDYAASQNYGGYGSMNTGNYAGGSMSGGGYGSQSYGGSYSGPGSYNGGGGSQYGSGFGGGGGYGGAGTYGGAGGSNIGSGIGGAFRNR